MSRTVGSGLTPFQLVHGALFGCEAAAHGDCCYLQNLDASQLMIRFDLRMPRTIVTRCHTARECSGSQVFAFVSLAYEHPSLLLCENHILVSVERVQRGDQLGSLLYCVTIQSLVGKFKSNFCMLYFDDGTVSGSADMSFMHDLQLVEEEACMSFRSTTQT